MAGVLNLDIPNKYINDAFLMIYLSIFVVVIVIIVDVVFPLFRASKDYLIRDSKSLWFCNFLRLRER